MKSKNPKNRAVMTDIRITTTVKISDCFLVGQETCLSSPRVSLI